MPAPAVRGAAAAASRAGAAAAERRRGAAHLVVPAVPAASALRRCRNPPTAAEAGALAARQGSAAPSAARQVSAALLAARPVEPAMESAAAAARRRVELSTAPLARRPAAQAGFVTRLYSQVKLRPAAAPAAPTASPRSPVALRVLLPGAQAVCGSGRAPPRALSAARRARRAESRPTRQIPRGILRNHYRHGDAIGLAGRRTVAARCFREKAFGTFLI